MLLCEKPLFFDWKWHTDNIIKETLICKSFMHQDIIAVFISKGPSVWWADLFSSSSTIQPMMSQKWVVSLDPKNKLRRHCKREGPVWCDVSSSTTKKLTLLTNTRFLMSQMFMFSQDSFTFITRTAFVPCRETRLYNSSVSLLNIQKKSFTHTHRFHRVPRRSLPGPQGPMSS